MTADKQCIFAYA